MGEKPKVAVVAMQGDFQKHIDMLTRLGANAYPARTPSDIARAEGIILPGGESTTIGKLLARSAWTHTRQALEERIRLGFQVGRDHADSIHELRKRPDALCQVTLSEQCRRWAGPGLRRIGSAGRRIYPYRLQGIRPGFHNGKLGLLDRHAGTV